MGQYTAEEFATAFGQFTASNKPFIFTCFKDVPGTCAEPSSSAFQKKLDALGHFPPRYTNVDVLTGHFNRQLDKLVANGFIEFKWEKRDLTAGRGDTYQAKLHGSSAIAQGDGARPAGAGGVLIEGNNSGVINIVTRAIDRNDSPDESASVIAHYLEVLASDLCGLKLSEIDVTAEEARHAPLRVPIFTCR